MAEGLTEEQLAERAGVPVDEIRRLVSLNLLLPTEEGRPFRAGDVHRIRLIEACDRAGMPIEAISRVVAEGKVSFAFVDLPSFRWSGRTSATYREWCQQIGISLDLVRRMHQALGFAAPHPEDRVREDDLPLITTVQLGLAAGLDPDVLIRAFRVYGESLHRITEMEAGIYHSYFEMPLLRSGLSQIEMMETAPQMGNAITMTLEPALLAMYRRQQEHTWIEDIVEHVEAALEEAGLRHRVERPPAMCFLDLSGYTRLTEERGDVAAADLATELAELVQHASLEHGGRPVKWLGDGVMFHFRDPGPSVNAALEMVELPSQAELPPAHVGLHAGPVVEKDGDFFGRTVNLASRIADVAAPGQVLVTPEVAEVSEKEGITYREIGPVELKGVARPVELLEARRDR